MLARSSSRSLWKLSSSLVGVGAVVVISLASLQLTRPYIVVGREWPLAERVEMKQISHLKWDELLQRFVDSEGNVDYAAWKNSPDDLRKLDEYLNSLSRLDERHSASKSDRLAFWINAYNAVTLRGILREYPTSSIQNHVARVWGYNIWRDLRLIVGDNTHSLGEIENTILRPLGEPRIHFAIVCASQGCPPLRSEAYSAERIEEQLEHNSLAFFADSTKCAVDVTRHELQLSPILNWYAADFGSPAPVLLQRIADWLPDEAKAVARSSNVRIVYLDYDWNLNEQNSETPPLPPPE